MGLAGRHARWDAGGARAGARGSTVRGVARGHLVGKDVYRRLGAKLDGLTVRVPWSPALRAVVGGFLRLPPVKQALMSDALRSRFLAGLRRATGRRAPPGVIDA